jgi:hypothetical protein
MIAIAVVSKYFIRRDNWLFFFFFLWPISHMSHMTAQVLCCQGTLNKLATWPLLKKKKKKNQMIAIAVLSKYFIRRDSWLFLFFFLFFFYFFL